MSQAQTRLGRPPTIDNPRGRILDEAAELFAREGYEGSSLGDLADAIGMTKAAIYHYFPNKKEIYEEIIVRTLEGLLETVTAEVSGHIDSEEATRRFMIAHATYFENHYYGFVTMLVGYGGMENVEMIHEAKKLRRTYEKLLKGIIENGIERGHFRAVDVSTTSRAILSMLSWMSRWFKPGKGRTAASFAEEYCELLLGGLRAAPQAEKD